MAGLAYIMMVISMGMALDTGNLFWNFGAVVFLFIGFVLTPEPRK